MFVVPGGPNFFRNIVMLLFNKTIFLFDKIVCRWWKYYRTVCCWNCNPLFFSVLHSSVKLTLYVIESSRKIIVWYAVQLRSSLVRPFNVRTVLVSIVFVINVRIKIFNSIKYFENGRQHLNWFGSYVFTLKYLNCFNKLLKVVSYFKSQLLHR